MENLILQKKCYHTHLVILNWIIKIIRRQKKNLIRKKDFLTKKSNFNLCLQRNNLKRNSKVFGKKLINLMIKFYLNEKKI